MEESINSPKYLFGNGNIVEYKYFIINKMQMKLHYIMKYI